MWSLRGLAVVAEFELCAFWGMKSTLISSLLVQPVVYLVLLTGGLESLIDPDVSFAGGNYLTYVFPGLLALQAVREFSGAIYRTTAERRWGQLALKRLAGVGPLGYVLGLTPPLIIAFLVEAVVSTPLALVLDAKMTLQGWLTTILLGSVLLIFWAALALLMTSLIRNYQQRDVVLGLLMLPLMFSAPVFFVLEDAPRYLQAIAVVNPLTYQVIAMRNAFNGELRWSILAVALLCTVAVVAAATISVAHTDLLSSERG
jgi:ABC-2 type transport system permease protein